MLDRILIINAGHALCVLRVYARRMGPRDLRAAQVGRLLAAAELANVHLQVALFEAGPHQGLDGSFQLLDFATSGLNSTVYVEAQYGNLSSRSAKSSLATARSINTSASPSRCRRTTPRPGYTGISSKMAQIRGSLPSRRGPHITDNPDRRARPPQQQSGSATPVPVRAREEVRERPTTRRSVERGNDHRLAKVDLVLSFELRRGSAC